MEFCQLNQIRNKTHLQRGRWAELYVLLIFVKKGYHLISGGRRTPFGQVDLILRGPGAYSSMPDQAGLRDKGALFVLEVKTVRGEGHFETRVTRRQIARLARACAWLFEQEQEQRQEQEREREQQRDQGPDFKVWMEAVYPRLFFVFVNPELRKLYFFEGSPGFDSALR